MPVRKHDHCLPAWLALLRAHSNRTRGVRYSLGVVLWELQTGQAPWGASMTPGEVAYRVANEHKRPAILARQCPPGPARQCQFGVDNPRTRLLQRRPRPGLTAMVAQPLAQPLSPCKAAALYRGVTVS